MSIQLEGYEVSKDERGLLSVSVPLYVQTLEETSTAAPATGNPFGLPEVGRVAQQLEGLGYQVTVTYEGTEGENDPSDEDGTFEFDSSFKEEPLESHPNWTNIKEEYGGRVVEKELVFPEFMPSVNTGRVGSLVRGLSGAYVDETRSRASQARRRNPLYGQKTYLALYIVFRRTYVRKTVPKKVLEEVGTTRAKLPAGLPTPKGRNWLVMPPKIRRRGNGWEISEELMLSKPGEKWPKAITSYIAR